MEPTKADQILKDAERYRRLYTRDANQLRDEQYANYNPRRTFLGAFNRFMLEEPTDAQAREAMNYYRDKQKEIIDREYGLRAVALKTGNDDVAREVGKFLKPSKEESDAIIAGVKNIAQRRYGPGSVMAEDAPFPAIKQDQLFYLNNVGVGVPPPP
jgi:hypothetical protein